MRSRGSQLRNDAAQAVLWLVAAALLIRRNSLWTPVATGALMVWLSGLSRRRGEPKPAVAVEESSGYARPPISPPLERASWRPMLKLVAAGMLINAAMLAEGTERAVAAGVFVAGAAAIVLSRISREQIARLNRVSVVLALFLMLVGLLRWGGGRFLSGSDDGEGAMANDNGSDVHASNRREDLTFRGVMLFPVKKKPSDQMRPPPPPLAVRRDEPKRADRKREPLVIPFSGVYWLFHRPDLEPPPSSLVQHGSPDEMFFRASDYRPLVMEAHQQLDQPIDLRCCAYFEVDIVNVDRYPGSVRVELIVSDTAYPIPVRHRLGSRPVLDQRRLGGVGSEPRPERLRFPIAAPPGSPMRFDRITLRFHLNQVRNTRSARMAIRQFVLMPRQ